MGEGRKGLLLAFAAYTIGVSSPLQFLIGVFVLEEPMPAARWVGFAIIWAALALFTADAVRGRRPVPLPVEAPT